MHGHFPLEPLKAAHPRAKVVVWLRHPVERVSSYHRFWLHRPLTKNRRHERFLAGDRTLESLAKIQADEIFEYLGEEPLSQIDFVGFVDNFEHEVARFERWIWRELKRLPRPRSLLKLASGREDRVPRQNRSPGTTAISERLRAELEQILAGEMELYRLAKKTQAKGHI